MTVTINSSKKEKLNSIQVCRALAFLSVLMLHRVPSWDLYFIFQYGSYGVMFFFIISGFIMAHLNCNGKIENPLVFIKKRAIRIYPIYWLSVILCMAILIFCSYIGFNEWTPLPDSSYIGWIITLTLLPLQDKYLINLVSWSLLYEIWYYILFALLIKYMREEFIIGIMAYGFFVIFINTAIDFKGVIATNYKLTISTLNLFFVIGSMIGYLYSDNVKKHSGKALFTAASCFIAQVLLGWEITVKPEIAGMITELIMLSTTITTILTLLYADRRGISMPRFLIYIGNMSYTLYLFHFILIFVYRGIFQTLFPDVHQYGLIEISTSYFFIFLVCWLIYEKVEKPMTNNLRNTVVNKKQTSVST